MPVKKGLISIFPPHSPLRVKYKDIFDLKEFYDALHEWLLEYGWGDNEENTEHWETHYGERIGQSGAKEMWIRWRVKKNAEGAPLVYHLDFDFHCLGIINTEVVKEGRKIKTNKGEVDMDINAYIERTYEKGLQENSLLKQFLTLFNRRVYSGTLEQRKKELYQEVYVLQNFIKQWFKLKRYLPYEETKGFFPSYAWPSHLKE